MKSTNMSPLGAFPQLTFGKVGTPKFGPPWFGVSATKSLPAQPLPSSPQM